MATATATFHRVTDLCLGKWVERQRATRKDGKLSEERAQKLDQIGFEWVSIVMAERGTSA